MIDFSRFFICFRCCLDLESPFGLSQRWIDRDGGWPNHDGSEAGLNTSHLPQRRGLLRNTFADDSKMGEKIFVMLATISCKLSLCFYYLLAVIILWCVWRWRIKNLWLARKICDWKLRERFFLLWLLIRPLPWQVRLHGRSKKLNKSIYFFVLGGRWHGDYSFIIFYYPGSPPAGVWCFFAFLFFLVFLFFFSLRLL